MSDAQLDRGQWWRKPFRMFQTNLREIDVCMDVDAVIDYLEGFGADAWLLSVGGIQAQYPTALPFHERNPHLAERNGGDLIGDALEAAHAKGIRLLGRMDFSKVPPKVAAEHPEWCYLSPSGDLQEHTAGLISVCPCGGYYQERVFDILDEVMGRYKVDGFFFNWTSMNEEDYYKHYHGVCHCLNCKTRWQAYSAGLELPSGPSDTHYSTWLGFTDEIIGNFLGRVRTFISDRLPDAGFIRGLGADIMFHEANNAMGRELWHHSTSEWVSSWKAYRPDVPVLVNSVAFMDMPYRMASEEPAHFAQYLIQCISRGGNPSTYIMGVPNKIPYACLDAAAEITRFHKKWTAVYDGLTPVAQTALVRPDRKQVEGMPYEEALSEFRGLYTAMQELHIPFDVLAQEYLEPTAANGGLDRYKTIVLPHLRRLSSKSAPILDRWVAAGGHLVASASSAVGDDGLIQVESLPSKRRLAMTGGRELWSSYIAPNQSGNKAHFYSGPIVPLYGSHYLFEWKEGAEVKYKMLARAPFAPPEKAYNNLQVDHPGYAVGAYGSGRGIVIPFTVGRAYRELGLSVLKDFYGMILREEGGAREPISFDLAEQVEVTVNQQGSNTVIHLVNMSGARRTNFGPHLPVASGSIKVGGKKVTAHALRSDQELVVRDGEIQLPPLDLFEVVVIGGL